MSKYKCLIVDDEESARMGLRSILTSQFSDRVEILGMADGVKSGLDLINDNKDVEIVFLDVRMNDGTGFDLLSRIKDFNIETVFVTAFDQYAVKAFEYAAIGYLLKPISIKSLQDFFDNYDNKNNKLKVRQNILIDRIINQNHKRIVLKHSKGFDIVLLDDIIRIESIRNYSEFTLKEGAKIIMSKTLKYYDDLLNDNGFYRIHQSHLVNLKHIKGFNNADGGYLFMTDGSHITVSKNKKADLVKLLGLV